MFQLHMHSDPGHSIVIVVDNGNNLDHLESHIAY